MQVQLNRILSLSLQETIDIPGHQTEAGGTVPPSLAVTNLKPDIVIIDKAKKSAQIFELTVPAEHRLKISNKLKMEKYQHFSSDITSHTVTVIPFEIGSHTGHINRENKSSLHTLHKYCRKDVKFKKFQDNISAIAVMGSYYIFNCRNLENWATPDPIFAPFPNQ